MTGAIHGLEGVRLLLHSQLEHVFLVVLPVSGSVPQVHIKHVRGDDFGESTLAILATDEFDKLVVNLGTVR